MNIALIIAGGVGKRTGNSVPKQFLTIFDIPIIVHTMKTIQRTQCYDEIYVVCSDGWQDFVVSYARQFEIDNFKGTITSGNTRFESFSNGIEKLSESHDSSDIISIQDANRPMTPISIFKDEIKLISESDCVLPLEACFDSMYIVENNNRVIDRCFDRSIIYKGQGPETCRLGKALELCRKAKENCINDMTLTALMIHFDQKVSYIDGSPLNFKITTNDDISIFKSMVQNSEF